MTLHHHRAVPKARWRLSASSSADHRARPSDPAALAIAREFMNGPAFSLPSRRHLGKRTLASMATILESAPAPGDTELVDGEVVVYLQRPTLDPRSSRVMRSCSTHERARAARFHSTKTAPPT